MRNSSSCSSSTSPNYLILTQHQLSNKQRLSSRFPLIQAPLTRSYAASVAAMPPVPGELKAEVQKLISSHEVIVFSKTTCPFCTKAKELLKSLNVKYEAVELDKTDKGPQYQDALMEITGQKTVPNTFINGHHLGGWTDMAEAHSTGRLVAAISSKSGVVKYDFDLAVIGGGSGGLAAAKEAAMLGKKVTLFDFVKPSEAGTTWGLGGTCVNVGCIPKKLMHKAALLGEDIHDAKSFGWEIPEKVKHNWTEMINSVQDHIGSLNWGYRVALRDKKVTYTNAYASIVDEHTIKSVKKNGQEASVSVDNIIIATGGRPKYLDIPGAKEYCITSDDLFSLPYCPGKTLCVGASYVSLECAGFLAALGMDTTVMVRSILLRGFDQQCAEMIGSYMEKHGVKFVRGAVPTKIECIEEGKPGRYRVTSKTTDGKEVTEEYNTILLATGRDPCTKGIGLENVGVKLHEKSGFVLVDEEERTNVANVFAIGDIGEGRPELTPVAIQAGRLLAHRLYEKGSDTKVDYSNIATTVFTPLEYGCIGYSEEAAIEKFGEDNIEVYHTHFMPLEWTVPHREENLCYAKLICNLRENEKVIGFHILGPNAGEITQGFAVALKLGATKADFDSTIGIHPTCSETLTTINVTKRSGASAEVTGC